MADSDDETDRGRVVRTILALACLTLVACAPEGPETEAPPANSRPNPFDPPVATNAEPPVAYPIELFEQGVEGTVILRLFADETGTIVPESTQVAEGSGHARLDSAAVTGVADMTFAPARREGIPVSTVFYQPVHFRIPDRSSPGGDRP